MRDQFLTYADWQESEAFMAKAVGIVSVLVVLLAGCATRHPAPEPVPEPVVVAPVAPAPEPAPVAAPTPPPAPAAEPAPPPPPAPKRAAPKVRKSSGGAAALKESQW
ncbi:MAG: hypothetical protein HZB26_10795 [Candidatus Hydrogenedentes bacterium]|nr:hypothetical protein [Candidatus Hydrogenedentota bacterium]